jgi:ADP-L-glycero-D-manno-heptose 6-epimerase
MDKESLIHVTGGAGFIGSNLVRHLNNAGYKNIVVIDDLTDGQKFRNLVGCEFSYVDKNDYENDMLCGFSDLMAPPDYVFHLGAISSTTHKNGKELMQNNYQFSIDLIHTCLSLGVPIQYASSASVYGNVGCMEGDHPEEDPLNCYAFSKHMVDNYVRDLFRSNSSVALSQIVGLRYFNVYGPNEEHKGGQASPIYQFWKQAKTSRTIKVFDVTADRDFIHVDDVCKVHLWLMSRDISGVMDVGVGESQSFWEVARIVANTLKNEFDHPEIELKSIPFPEELEGQYQFYTAAAPHLYDLGYPESLLTLDEGVPQYVRELERRDAKRKHKYLSPYGLWRNKGK